ncbi:CCHC-type domain-containing protein [Mycena kentingensis (nom. inval.)]|nr:CCHC-type domain-containing protein [Mycena kentingensis (nom. inval.)]
MSGLPAQKFQEWIKEIELARGTRHPNLLQIYGVVSDPTSMPGLYEVIYHSLEIRSLSLRIGFKGTAQMANAFLFLCPPDSAFLPHVTSQDLAYWSLDPTGTHRLPRAVASLLRLPRFLVEREITTFAYEEGVCDNLRKVHSALGFDPKSADAARGLGFPILEPISAASETFDALEPDEPHREPVTLEHFEMAHNNNNNVPGVVPIGNPVVAQAAPAQAGAAAGGQPQNGAQPNNAAGVQQLPANQQADDQAAGGRGRAIRVPEPYERDRPTWDGRNPEKTLRGYLEQCNALFTKGRLEDEAERKRLMVGYLKDDIIKDEWKSLPEFAAGSYDAFKDAVLKLYPELDEEEHGSIQSVEKVNRDYPMISRTDHGRFLRWKVSFIKQVAKCNAPNLLYGPRISNAHAVGMIYGNLTADFADSLRHLLDSPSVETIIGPRQNAAGIVLREERWTYLEVLQVAEYLSERSSIGITEFSRSPNGATVPGTGAVSETDRFKREVDERLNLLSNEVVQIKDAVAVQEKQIEQETREHPFSVKPHKDKGYKVVRKWDDEGLIEDMLKRTGDTALDGVKMRELETLLPFLVLPYLSPGGSETLFTKARTRQSTATPAKAKVAATPASSSTTRSKPPQKSDASPKIKKEKGATGTSAANPEPLIQLIPAGAHPLWSLLLHPSAGPLVEALRELCENHKIDAEKAANASAYVSSFHVPNVSMGDDYDYKGIFELGDALSELVRCAGIAMVEDVKTEWFFFPDLEFNPTRYLDPKFRIPIDKKVSLPTANELNDAPTLYRSALLPRKRRACTPDEDDEEEGSEEDEEGTQSESDDDEDDNDQRVAAQTSPPSLPRPPNPPSSPRRPDPAGIRNLPTPSKTKAKTPVEDGTVLVEDSETEAAPQRKAKTAKSTRNTKTAPVQTPKPKPKPYVEVPPKPTGKKPSGRKPPTSREFLSDTDDGPDGNDQMDVDEPAPPPTTTAKGKKKEEKGKGKAKAKAKEATPEEDVEEESEQVVEEPEPEKKGKKRARATKDDGGAPPKRSKRAKSPDPVKALYHTTKSQPPLPELDTEENAHLVLEGLKTLYSQNASYSRDVGRFFVPLQIEGQDIALALARRKIRAPRSDSYAGVRPFMRASKTNTFEPWYATPEAIKLKPLEEMEKDTPYEPLVPCTDCVVRGTLCVPNPGHSPCAGCDDRRSHCTHALSGVELHRMWSTLSQEAELFGPLLNSLADDVIDAHRIASAATTAQQSAMLHLDQRVARFKSMAYDLLYVAGPDAFEKRFAAFNDESARTFLDGWFKTMEHKLNGTVSNDASLDADSARSLRQMEIGDALIAKTKKAFSSAGNAVASSSKKKLVPSSSSPILSASLESVVSPAAAHFSPLVVDPALV